jgi:hypothetical protein
MLCITQLTCPLVNTPIDSKKKNVERLLLVDVLSEGLLLVDVLSEGLLRLGVLSEGLLRLGVLSEGLLRLGCMASETAASSLCYLTGVIWQVSS